jgi:hypothetical protein
MTYARASWSFGDINFSVIHAGFVEDLESRPALRASRFGVNGDLAH